MFTDDRHLSRWVTLFPLLIIGASFILINFFVFFFEYQHHVDLTKEAKKSYLQEQKTRLIERVGSIETIIAQFQKNRIDEDDDTLIKTLQTLLAPEEGSTYLIKVENLMEPKIAKIVMSSKRPAEVGAYLPNPSICPLSKKDILQVLEKGAVFDSRVFDSNYTKYYHYKSLGYKDWVLGKCIQVENFESFYAQKAKTNKEELYTHAGVTFLATLILAVIGYIGVTFLGRKLNTRLSHYQAELTSSNEALMKNNEQLQKQLFIDALTGLKNRKALERDISAMSMPRLILLDIDDFRKLNDYFGSATGDVVLSHVAKDLQEFASSHLMEVYRINADQFALLEESELDVERYEELAIALVDAFKGRVMQLSDDSEDIELNCTIGFSLESEDVFEKAMMALKKAKESERDYLCYFRNIDRSKEYAEQIKWSNFIKEAINQDQVVPFYQPIFDREGKIVKYECLVRIVNEEEESFAPGLFLSTSKRVKRYADIEKMLIEKSFKAISGTQKIVSLNLLARDMTDSDVSNFVIDKMNYYGVSKQIVFEVLEDESIEHIERVAVFIDRVKRMGAKIAIDDFGTGYSNFSYLLQLKPDYIKIDGSLIRKVDVDANAYAIVNAIIVFAKKLGIKVIAEFVHSQEVYATCLELGVDEFQGFYLAEPRAKIG